MAFFLATKLCPALGSLARLHPGGMYASRGPREGGQAPVGPPGARDGDVQHHPVAPSHTPSLCGDISRTPVRSDENL